MPQKFPYTTMSMFSSKYWHPLYMEATNASDMDKMNALRLIDKFLTAFTIRLEYTDDYKMYVSSMELEKQRIYGLEVYDTYYKLLVNYPRPKGRELRASTQRTCLVQDRTR